ncbi:hypothetical protein O3M35_008010 [Rhynocoris fuscipes]|uniref:Cytochrome b n=1 Tax=Rhynocoris fuscipes TaxID=488301 RepID=A0AAW1D5J8_9HEMI
MQVIWTFMPFKQISFMVRANRSYIHILYISFGLISALYSSFKDTAPIWWTIL